MRLVSLLLVGLVGAPQNAPAQSHSADRSSAEPATSETEATRRALLRGHEALVAYEKGDYSAAFGLFGQAEALAHSPVFLLYQARAAEKQGGWLLARALLSHCASEPLQKGAPPAWRNALRSASAELLLLEQRLPRLRLVLDENVSLPVVARVDGKLVEWSGVDPLEMALDPGTRSLVVTDPGGQSQAFLLEMKPTRLLQVLISIRRPGRLREDAQPSVLDPVHTPALWDSKARRAALSAFILGGTGLAAGIGTFAAALVLAGEIKAACREFEGNQCPQTELTKVGRAVRMANLASIGFVVAGVGGTTGLGLWVLSSKRARRDLNIQLRPDRLALTLHF